MHGERAALQNANTEYRGRAGDVIRQKLEDKVVAHAGPAAPHGQVTARSTAGDAACPTRRSRSATSCIRPRTIRPPAAAPRHRPVVGASQGACDATSRSWRPGTTRVRFDRPAESDESRPAAPPDRGGLPYVDKDRQQSQIDESFSGNLAAKATADQVLPPIKTAFGWHIVQVCQPTASPDPATPRPRPMAGRTSRHSLATVRCSSRRQRRGPGLDGAGQLDEKPDGRDLRDRGQRRVGGGHQTGSTVQPHFTWSGDHHGRTRPAQDDPRQRLLQLVPGAPSTTRS